jgi:hypothetical protein
MKQNPFESIQNLTVEKIIKNENKVLIDGCMDVVENTGWYREIYGVKKSVQLDADYLRGVRKELVRFNDLFYEENVFTTQKVVKELKTIKELVATKLSNINQTDKRVPKKVRRNYTKESRNEHDKARHVLGDISYQYMQIHKNTRHSILHSNKQTIYAPLENLILSIGKLTTAKRDYSHRYNIKPSSTADNHADEELVTTALYQSLIEQESVSIITMDSDISRLMVKTVEYLTQFNHPKKDEIKFRLLENPLKVYYRGKEGMQLTFDTSDFEQTGFFFMKQDSKAVREQINSYARNLKLNF